MLAFGYLSAQENAVLDSLYNLLDPSGNDTTTALLYAEIANRYAFSNSDSTKFYSTKALTLSEELNFDRGVLRSVE